MSDSTDKPTHEDPQAPIAQAKPAPAPAATPGKGVVRRGRGAFKLAMTGTGGAAGSPTSKPGEGDARFPQPSKAPVAEQTTAGTVREQLFRRERRRHRVILVGKPGKLMMCEPRLQNVRLRLNKFGNKIVRQIHLRCPTREELEDFNPPEPDGDELMVSMQRGAKAPLTSGVVVHTHVRDAAVALEKELGELLKLDDMKDLNKVIRLDFGEAMLATSRQRVFELSTNELIRKVDNEVFEVHFVRDAPIDVLRAFDATVAGIIRDASSPSAVSPPPEAEEPAEEGAPKAKPDMEEWVRCNLVIESTEKQANVIVRAAWEKGEGRFRLLGIENPGITFSWVMFGFGSDSNDSVQCNLSCRCHHTSKARHHPASEFAEKVLEKVSLIEYKRQRYQSASFTGVFEESEDINYNLIAIEIEETEMNRLPDGVRAFQTNSLVAEKLNIATQKQRQINRRRYMNNRQNSGPTAADGEGGDEDEDEESTDPQQPVDDHRIVRTRSAYVEWSRTEDSSGQQQLLRGLRGAFDVYEKLAEATKGFREEEARPRIRAL